MGYVKGKEIYRANIEGATTQPSEENGWRGKINYARDAKMDAGIEEPIHILQAEVKRQNPKLAKVLESWQLEARETIDIERSLTSKPRLTDRQTLRFSDTIKKEVRSGKRMLLTGYVVYLL